MYHTQDESANLSFIICDKIYICVQFLKRKTGTFPERYPVGGGTRCGPVRRRSGVHFRRRTPNRRLCEKNNIPG